MSLPPPNLPPPQPLSPPPLGAPPAPDLTGPAGAAPPKKSGGCGKVLLIFLIVFAIGVAGVIGLVVVGGIWFSNKVQNAVEVKDCPFLAQDQAKNVFGPDAEVQSLSGFYKLTLGVVLDNRGLPDAPSCVVTQGEGAAVSRIARSTGGKAVYDQNRQAANPVSEDRGGGITVTREGWFADDVQGLGDEAFCTASDLSGSVGVLARSGDTVWYVSMQASPDFNPGELEAGEDGVIRNPAACQRAVEVAHALIG